MLAHAARTDTGRRKNNEDALLAEPGLGLFAVADGLGGYEGGEQASRLALDALGAFVRRNLADGETTWPWAADRNRSLAENLLAIGVRLGHDAITERRSGPLAQMGSTVVALLFAGDAVAVAHVGDSRAYRLRGGVLTPLTRDHSVHAELEAAGVALPPRGQFHLGHVVTRALGMREGAAADTSLHPVLPGDVYLLCTDGVSEPLGDARLAALLAEPDAGRACMQLVDAAYAAGSRDNMTAIVVRAGHSSAASSWSP